MNILEAMLCKKPVVASHNRGHDELIDDRQNGLLVPPDDVPLYAECIIRVNMDKALQTCMGNAGYIKAQSYTAQAVSAELRTIYGL